MHNLRGYQGVAAQLPDLDKAPKTPPKGRPFELHYVIPSDLDAVFEDVHPLVLLGALAYVAAAVDEGIARMVPYCRRERASWAQIGEVLGITKQSAWARYSNED